MTLLNRKFDHLNIGVPNLDSAIKYYEETLGFKYLGRYEGSLKFAFLTDGNFTYELIERENITVSTFDHIAYVSEDIQADYDYYNKLGLTTTEIGIVPYLFENGVKYFFIKGANDERIEFCERL